MKKRICAAVLLVLGSTVALAENRTSLSIDGRSFSLKETEMSVREKIEDLGPNFQFGYPFEKREPGKKYSYTILRKEGDNLKAEGVVWFNDAGRVYGITKNWTDTTGTDALQLAKSLVTVIAALSKSDRQTISVLTTISKEPNSENYTLWFSTGNNQITVSYTLQPNGPNFVGLQEAINDSGK